MLAFRGSTVCSDPIHCLYLLSLVARATTTIISANLAIKRWGNTFPGVACVVELVDRFAQHCHRIENIGESVRDQAPTRSRAPAAEAEPITT